MAKAPRRLPRWARVALVVLVLAAGWPFFATWLLHWMIFKPTLNTPALGARLPEGIEEAYYGARDGPRIVGYLVHSVGPRRRAVVFFHGNVGTAWNGVAFARTLAADGADVLLGEFRGYGNSDGSPSLRGIQDDGDAAVDYMIESRRIDPSHLVVIGQSLGGAMAVHTLTRHRLAGGVLLSTFSTFKGVGGLLMRTIPDAWALDTTENLQHLHSPLAIFHGTADEVIPVAVGRRVYAEAREPKELHIIEGDGHNLHHLHALVGPVVERFAP